MEICAFCGTPIAAKQVYCSNCGKFTQPDIESEVKRVAADVVANGQRAEPNYRALAQKLPPDAIPHLKARIRDYAIRLRGGNQPPPPPPPPSAPAPPSPIKPVKPIVPPSGETPPAEAAMRKMMTPPPSRQVTPNPAPLPPPIKPFNLSEFEAKTQPGCAANASPSEEVIPAPPARAVTRNKPAQTKPTPSNPAQNRSMQRTASASPASLPRKPRPQAAVKFTKTTFDHPKSYDQKAKLNMDKVDGLSVTVSGGLAGAGTAIRDRRDQIIVTNAIGTGLAAILTMMIIALLTIGPGVFGAQVFGRLEAEAMQSIAAFIFIIAIMFSFPITPVVYKLLRGRRTLINDTRVNLLADLLDALQDDLRRVKVTANLSGPQSAEKLQRKGTSSNQRPKHYYKDYWLRLRSRSRSRNLVEVRITEHCKVGMAYWRRGSVSGKSKLKSAKSESRYIVRVAIIPNAEYFTTARFTPEALAMLSPETKVLRAESYSDHLIVVAQVLHPPSFQKICAIFHYAQQHIRRL